MIRVPNKRCIYNLSQKSLRASKSRNYIAISAIALTALLFTALFTVVLSLNEAFQQANFLQAGGFAQGTFKYLTQQQFEELKQDPLIKQWGERRFLGMATGTAFQKNHVEIGYSDPNEAHWTFCDPIEGRLPKEGTNEAATDLEILKLLGVEPKLGAEFTLTINVDGQQTTQTFTLCGWWDKREPVVANHVLIPESRLEEVLQQVNVAPPGSDGMTGSWNLDVMFQNSLQIERNVNRVLSNHGYQSETSADKQTYIATGVNWGYSGTQLSSNMDFGMIVSIAAVIVLIVITGYLIIYNVFQISVVGDIRFYGLLKTIGTTGKQIRRMIRWQALLLSLCGIPIGLLLGWLFGAKLTPVILNQLNGVVADTVSLHPAVFVVSALFTLVTVFLSCSKPGRMAAKISPIEAVRYTQADSPKKEKRAVKKKFSLLDMAAANVGRSKTKTAITVLSLSLSLVMLNSTVMFTNGFDMDKYLNNFTSSDFVLASASYFQSNGVGDWVSEEAIQAVQQQGEVTNAARVYGSSKGTLEFVSEQRFRQTNSKHYDAQQVEQMLKDEEHNEKGQVADSIQLSGMELAALDKLTVLEGDLNLLKQPGKQYIAAVYKTDDYGSPEEDSNWAKVGDTVTIRYVDEYEYYNPDTGEVYPSWDAIGDRPYQTRATKYRDVDYTVAATVAVPYALSYRYFGSDAFVLNDQTFVQDTQTNSVMLYAFDTTPQSNTAMEQFLKDYTETVNLSYDYESKATYQAQFNNFRSMFLLLGGALSLVMAVIGVLNFFHAILTGIVTRRKEFAILQSIGMTGRQLKRMLVYEGILYVAMTALFAVIGSIIGEQLVAKVLSGILWFFTYHFTIAPVLLILPIFFLMGCALPLVIYRAAAKQTLVERLREMDN